MEKVLLPVLRPVVANPMREGKSALQRMLRLSLSFLNGDVDPRITFTRASNATYFNSARVLTTAGNNVARLDYDPATLLPRGLLVEEQRTNNETNGIALTKGNAGDTVTQNTVGPDGVTNSAWAITGDGTSSNHVVTQASVTPTSGNTYTISVFMKAGTQSLLQVATGIAHSGATVYCNYNLSTTSPAMTAGAGIVSGSNFQTYIGGGWYRCGFSYVASATVSGAAIATYPISSMSDTRLPINSLATTYYRFGGQYESTTGMGSATFVTSYIPTTTASATRSADSASMTGTNFSSWWNQPAGTLYTEFSVPVTPSATSRAAQISGTAGFDCLITSGMINQYKINAAFVGVGTTRSLNTVIKSIGAFDTTSAGINVDGVTEVTSANAPSGNTALYIGSAGGTSSFLNGHVRRLMFYPVKFDNATRKALTA